MEEFLVHLDSGKAFIYVSLAAVVITLITNFIFKGNKFVKYIPGIIFIVVGLYSLYQMNGDFTSSDSISNLLLFLICFVGGTIGLLVGLIIGIYKKPKRIKKNKQ